MKFVQRSRNPIPASMASTFTGSVQLDAVLPATDGVMINTVTFAPSARTYWHSHESGQILQVVSGYGWVCTEGEVPQRLAQGDTVWVPAGEHHWHGAGTDSFITHTAVSLGATAWGEEVTDEQYRAAGVSAVN
jgi:quercetin dioxygenase-like cupin family protein